MNCKSGIQYNQNKIIEEFREKFQGNEKFPKRISDPILCDEIESFILEAIQSAKKEAVEEIVKILTKEHYGIDYKSDKCNECSNYDRINEVVKYLENLEAKELLKRD